MFDFRDFVPSRSRGGGLLSRPRYETLRAVVAEARRWAAREGVEVINIETLMLPDLWEQDGGSERPALRQVGERVTWNQCVRVWYRAP